jgi:hypothetical protein
VLEDIDGLDPLDPSHSNAVEDITRTRGQEIFDVTELETSAGQDTLTQQGRVRFICGPPQSGYPA